MYIIIGFVIGTFISFILLFSVTTIAGNMGDYAVIIYSIYIAIALIIVSTICIIETIKRYCSSKDWA